MKIRNIFKKSFFMLMAITMMVTYMPIINVEAAVGSITVSSPSSNVIDEGGSVSYTLTYNNAQAVYLYVQDIIYNGIIADVSITSISSTEKKVTLSNIQGNKGYYTIKVGPNTGYDTDGNYFNAVTGITPFYLNSQDQAPLPDEDISAPSMQCMPASTYQVSQNGTTTYEIVYTDANNFTVSLDKNDILFSGFNANVAVTNITATKKLVTFSNITGDAGVKHFSIVAGTAEDEFGNITGAMSHSYEFNLKAKVNVIDNPPTISLTAISKTSIYKGESIVYTVTYADDKGIKNITLKASDIKFHGDFTANVSISTTGNTRYITLSNVQGPVGDKYISIVAGTAEDTASQKVGSVTAPANLKFNLKNKTVQEDPNNPGEEREPNPNTGK